jgi:hypothetical protein
VYYRDYNIADTVEAAVIRKQRKAAKMNAKARSQAKKMENVDSAVETTLAETCNDLEAEILSFGNAKGALRTYLQEQFKSRKLLHFGKYHTIPLMSEFRSRAKPYALRMNPSPITGVRISTDMQITYLKNLLFAMIKEDLRRPLEATARPEDTQLVRRLPVISEMFLNPTSIRLKKLQESRIAAMVAPKDNPWFARLTQEYVGKILYDGGYFRVFAIQFVPNKGRNVYPCWEATTEPVYKDQNGEWVVHNRHLVLMEDGTRKLLKSAMEGFALAEYSNGDDVDPVRLPFADTCHAKFLAREARLASSYPSLPTAKRKRHLSATYAPQTITLTLTLTLTSLHSYPNPKPNPNP